MLADPTANAAGRVHLGQLKPHDDLCVGTRWWKRIQRYFRSNQEGVNGISDNGSDGLSLCRRNSAIVVARRKPVRLKRGPLEDPAGSVYFLQGKSRQAQDWLKVLTGHNGFGAYGTVFLTDDARAVHGPRQTSSTVHKGGSKSYGPPALEAVPAESFVEGNGSYGGRGAEVSARNAAGLTAACANPKVQDRRPEAFETC
jgi:hypothetical protein